MANYGARAKFRTGTDKTFIYRGGLLLLACAMGSSILGPLRALPSSLLSLTLLLAPVAVQGGSLPGGLRHPPGSVFSIFHLPQDLADSL